VGCCPGTCTHVWHYAQAVARLFPELERDTRERVDLGIAFNEESGVMGFRAEHDRNLAVDGQSGTLLRIYREHQMSGDNAFLRRNWPKIKRAYAPLLERDPDGDGVMESEQMNTLDAPWFGKVSWLSSLYVAALHAGAQMASEMGDSSFASRCRDIAARGAGSITSQLFNGEYYMALVDPNRPDTINSGAGCELDQVFGQSWAWQVGLGRVLPEKETTTATTPRAATRGTKSSAATITRAQWLATASSFRPAASSTTARASTWASRLACLPKTSKLPLPRRRAGAASRSKHWGLK
jgi:non-lysosomal glucosylceramidase